MNPMPFHDFITDPSGFRLGGAWWWNHLGTTTSCHGQYRTLAWKEHHGSLESDLLVVGWGWRLFLILLTIPTKMDPFKMMSFTLFFFKFKIKNTFLLMQNRMSFWRFITEKPRFLPKPTIELVKSLSKPTIGDPHLAIKMNQPLEHSRG